MDLAAVMDEVGDCVDQVPGLRVYRWPSGRVSPPAAVVNYPTEVEYVTTYGRGVNRLKLPLVIAFGRPTARATRNALAAYLDGAGPESVAALVDAWDWQSCDSATVVTAEVDVVSIAAVDYLAALLTLDIIGKGA